MRLPVLYLLLLLCSTFLCGQKSAYIPLYLLDTNTVDGAQFSWDKTAQSDNFTLIWGDSVGMDPAQFPDPSLTFDPVAVLDTLEKIYQAFIELGFADEYDGSNLSQYKIPVVVYNTWGHDGAQGWANGGYADGIIGAFWVHPLAMQTGHVTAHELTHSLQAQHNIDIRKQNGLGLVWPDAGIFWETHANFMRNLLYPEAVTAWGMDLYHTETWGDWKNTYENYPLLMAIMDYDGIDIINRLWREARSDEYPLQTYKRLLGYQQLVFNDQMYLHIRRMATYDFPNNHLGDYFRQYRNADLMYLLPAAQSTWTILKADTLIPGHYTCPIELAPEEYGYNVIPLYPETDSCPVIVRFKGHTEVNTHAGWRYGFAAALPDGTISRYSDSYEQPDQEIAFQMEGNESHLYLIVMGAPSDAITTNTTNDTWHGYPKHFRFPYDLVISGAAPEGHQAPEQFRAQLKHNGHLHPNGGGWVDNSATVDPSAYVGPHAMVLGNSQVTGQARIEHTAIVRDAVVTNNAIVRDNALVTGSTILDQAIVGGQAMAENCTLWDQALVHMRARVTNYKLHGDIEVGGDVIVYNLNGDCDNGVYYRMTNYYQDNLLECDGRTAGHPANADVNSNAVPFDANELTLVCSCTTWPDCASVGIKDSDDEYAVAEVFPNPVTDLLYIRLPRMSGEDVFVLVYNALGEVQYQNFLESPADSIDVATLAPGLYFVQVSTAHQALGVFPVMVE